MAQFKQRLAYFSHNPSLLECTLGHRPPTHAHAHPHTPSLSFSACICCVLTTGVTVLSIMGHGGSTESLRSSRQRGFMWPKKIFRFSLSHSSSLSLSPSIFCLCAHTKTPCLFSVYIFTSFCVKERCLSAEFDRTRSPNAGLELLQKNVKLGQKKGGQRSESTIMKNTW